MANAAARVEAGITAGKLVERLWAKRESGWTEIAVGDGRTQGSLSITGPGGQPLAGQAQNLAADGGGINIEFSGDGWTVQRTLRFVDDGRWIRVTNTFKSSGAITLHSFKDVYRATATPTWAYSPSVGGFNPDGMYKAPLILVQSGKIALGVVPDVETLDRGSLKRYNHALDLNVPGTTLLSVGYVPAVRAFHTVFKEDLDRTWTASDPVENDYFLYVDGNTRPGEAYREPVRFHWRHFGRAALPRAAAEQSGTDPKYLACHLWDEWREAVWARESPDSWLKVKMPDGSVGGAVSMRRARSPARSVYLGAWFNSLRTSYGMALYARGTSKPELLDLAKQTLNLAMKAPGREGAFKCFAVPDASGDQVVWGAGDGAGKSVTSGYLGFDMSWTGYWMLKWHEAGLPESAPVVQRCSRLADFLIARQRPDGMLPTRFDEGGNDERILSDDVRAETAPVVRFLFELCKSNRDLRYLQAAKKGLAYLDRNVVADRKWYDFETFWSCSPRLAALDQRTQQWPANDLALIHAVAAYLQAYQITHEKPYLARGEALLDYLLLYQQAWTNPALENLSGPVMLLGGFTTQNSDGEWSDARQSLAGEMIMDYYRETGKAEYLERGIAALRAQFPVSPSENWAHQAYGGKAGVSSFHWGTGSGLAGIEMEQDNLRDAVCDIAAKRCVGVNGVNLTGWKMEGARLDLQMDSPYRWTRKPVVVFYGADANREYRLSVNGRDAGRFTGKQLRNGVNAAVLER
jgi:hypothetical protein